MSTNSKYKNICILRLSAIGDCINASAAINLIKETYPEAKITWIIGKTEAPLFSDMNDIVFIIFNKKGGIKEYFKIYKLLKNTKFDVLLNMQTAIRASILSLFIKAQTKYGFNEERASDGQHFFTNAKISTPKNNHVLDGFMEFAYSIGCPISKPVWHFEFSKEEMEFANSYTSNSKTLILTPCSSKEFKNWTIHGYSEICRYALSKGFKIIICGGRSQFEQDVSKEIISFVSEHDSSYTNNITNLVGKTTLRQLLALIKQSSLLIAPDSGPIHMANALNIPVLGIYAHHNPTRVGPYNFQKYVVSIYNKCIALEHPSNNIKWKSRVHDKNAMLKIDSSQVREAFDCILKDYHLE